MPMCEVCSYLRRSQNFGNLKEYMQSAASVMDLYYIGDIDILSSNCNIDFLTGDIGVKNPINLNVRCNHCNSAFELYYNSVMNLGYLIAKEETVNISRK